MYCHYCGQKIDNDSMFCPYCGVKQDINNTNNNVVNKNNDNIVSKDFNDHSNNTNCVNNKNYLNSNFDTQNTQKPSLSNLAKGLIIAVGIIVVAIITLLIIILSNSQVSIDLNDYLIICESGYDGYGSIEYYLDENQMSKDYAGKINLTSDENNNFVMNNQITWGESPIYIIANNVSVSSDASNNLHNGDIITFTWDDSVNEDLEKYFNISLKSKNYTYTISNLDEAEYEDFFSYVTVDFSGVSPNGTASITVDCDWLHSFYFIINNISGLSNGDIITVFINESVLSDVVSNTGKAPIETSKEYTVDGLNDYITSLENLPVESLDIMQSISTEFISEEINTLENTSLDQINYLGCYLTLPRANKGNQIYLLYDIVETSSVDGESNTYNRYWYCCFKYATIDPNGKFSIDYNNNFYPEYTYLWFGSILGEGFTFNLNGTTFYISGYETFDELINAINSNNEYILDKNVN